MRSHNCNAQPTPELQRFRVLAGNPSEEITLTGLQVDLRFSWWPPVVGTDGDPSLGFPDVTPAIDGRTAFNLSPSGAPVVRDDAQWQWSNEVDGAADFFSTADDPELQAVDQNVTFTAWVKFTGILPLVGNRPILSKMTGPSAGEYCLEFVPASNGSPRLRFSFLTPAGRLFQVTSSANVPVNEWVLCVGYYDDRRSLAGVLFNSSGSVIRAYTAGTYASTGDFQIGAQTTAALGSRYFDGRIDQVTRWNRLLTIAELLWLQQNDLWNGVIPTIRLASGDPLEYETVETDLPAAPSNLEAVGDVSNEVDLYWTDNALGIGNVEVFRSIDAGAYALIATIDNDLGTYHDSEADVSSAGYSYKIRATNINGASADSAVAVASAAPPPAFIFDTSRNSQNLPLV